MTDPRASSRERHAAGAVGARLLSSLPGTLTSFLPVGLCAACWPAYAGLLASLGIGFLLETVYLLPLTILSLGLAVGGLAYRSRTRRGLGPAMAGLVASSLIVLGKFGLQADPVVTTGIGVLISASVWNAWPQKTASRGACPACEAAGLHQESHRNHSKGA
ncbi:MAG: hypothetical protein ACE5HD_05755 [Acidobacteriota bacterium]